MRAADGCIVYLQLNSSGGSGKIAVDQKVKKEHGG